MMHILVDTIPKHPKECLFSISSTDRCLYNCKLKMDDDFDWEYRTFNGHCKCSLSENKDCPYLKQLLDHFGNKPKENKSEEEFAKIVEETRQELYNQLGVPESLIEEGSLATAARITQYEEEKFKEHFREAIDAAIDSCFREPEDWDDFAGNSTSINDTKYLI